MQVPTLPSKDKPAKHYGVYSWRQGAIYLFKAVDQLNEGIYYNVHFGNHSIVDENSIYCIFNQTLFVGRECLQQLKSDTRSSIKVVEHID